MNNLRARHRKSETHTKNVKNNVIIGFGGGSRKVMSRRLCASKFTSGEYILVPPNYFVQKGVQKFFKVNLVDWNQFNFRINLLIYII